MHVAAGLRHQIHMGCLMTGLSIQCLVVPLSLWRFIFAGHVWILYFSILVLSPFVTSADLRFLGPESKERIRSGLPPEALHDDVIVVCKCGSTMVYDRDSGVRVCHLCLDKLSGSLPANRLPG